MCSFEECPKCGEGMMWLDGGWCVLYCTNCRWLQCFNKKGLAFERKLRKDAMESLS